VGIEMEVPDKAQKAGNKKEILLILVNHLENKLRKL